MAGYASITVHSNFGRVITALKTKKHLEQAGQFVRSAAVLNAPAESGHLRQNILLDVKRDGEDLVAEISTSPAVRYAPFVELGTGPKGFQNHEGISPNVNPTYSMSPWYIHESMIDPGLAEKYHWQVFETKAGKFYRCYGQPAHPFLYPALHDHEQEVLRILQDGYKKAMKG